MIVIGSTEQQWHGTHHTSIPCLVIGSAGCSSEGQSESYVRCEEWPNSQYRANAKQCLVCPHPARVARTLSNVDVWSVHATARAISHILLGQSFSSNDEDFVQAHFTE